MIHPGRSSLCGRLLPAFLLLVSFAPCLHAAWFDTNYTYKRRITLQASQVPDGTFADFPVLITEANLDTAFFSHVQKSTADNLDVIFTDGNEVAKLDREIVLFNAGGQLEAWVRVPWLDGTADTALYVYYGYAGADEPNTPTTWASSFRGVWHLQQTPSLSVADIRDSSVYGHHGTSWNMETGDSVPGQIGRSLSFDGLMEYVNCGDSANLRITGSATLSAWINLNDPNADQYMRIICKKPTWDASQGYSFECNPRNQYLTVLGSGSDVARATSASYSTNWHFVTGVINDKTGTLYLDGKDITDDSGVDALVAGTQALTIAKLSGETDYFDGQLDEVRVAAVARDADWVMAEYNNQSDPGSFYTVAPEENRYTPTITPTFTRSATVTLTLTATASLTPSYTPTISPTPTVSPTSTITPTRTASATASASPTVTPTPSITPSPTQSSTSTATLTATISPTSTISPTASPTFTLTPSPTLDVAALDLDRVILYPNPYRADFKPRPEVTFINLPQRAVIRIYNVSGKLVWQTTKDSNSNRQTWNLNNEQGRPVASGVYIYKIKSGWREKSGKLVLLR
ncbi:MAG: LamG-like jellyroll fold domain-containing protein [candidate division FCPU426 bacterium]